MFNEENRTMIDIEANSHEAQYDNICFMNTTRNNSNAAYAASALEPGLSSGPQHNHGQNVQPTYGQPHEEWGDNINTSAGQPGAVLIPPPAYTYQDYPQQQGYLPPPQGYQPSPLGYPPPPQGYPLPLQGYPPPPQGYPPPPQGYPPPPLGYTDANQGVYYSQPVTVIYTVQKSPDKDVVFAQTTTGPVTAQVITFYEDPKRRSEFIRKVYTILFFQLVICSASVAVCVFVDPVHTWVNQHLYLLYLFLFFYLACVIVQCCCLEKMLSTNAVSVGVLIVLTLSLSAMAGFMSSRYGKEAVLLAIGTTALIVLLLTLLACQSKYDFTSFLGIMFVIVVIFILFGFFTIFLSPYIPVIRLIWACIGAIITSVYIVIDTQMLMSGKKYTLDTDMYIFGAIRLFVDIVLLFLYMLEITGKK